MIYNFRSFHPQLGDYVHIHMRGAEASAESMGETVTDSFFMLCYMMGLGIVIALPLPPRDTLADDC